MAGITVKSANGKAESEDNSNQKDFKKALPITGQPAGSNRRALDVISLGVFTVSSDNVVEAGSDDNLVIKAAHGARVGDMFRLEASANNISEFEVHIDEIIDANSFKLSCVLSANLEAGDEYTLLRPVSQRFTEDGASLNTVIPAPLAFVLDGVTTEVVQDNVTPGNNTPLPVQITSATGPINITAGDLNVQLDDMGVNADKTRIGDGSGNYLGINASTEALVNDADANTKLANILTELGLKADLSETQPVSAASLPLPTGAASEATLELVRILLNTISGKDFATQTTIAAILTELGLKADLSETQPVSAASLPLPTGASTEAKQDAIVTAISSIAAGGDATAANQVISNTKLTDLNTSNGAIADAAVTNPASSASHTALLKGILTLLTSANTKLDTLDTNSSPGLDSVSNSVATSATLTPPAGAIGMIIQNGLNSDDAIRFTGSAGTPSASVGFFLDAGQSTSYMPAGVVKFARVGTGTPDVSVIWFV